MEEDERDQLYYLGEKLKHESRYRIQQEAVNSRLMTEQDLLRKKLAEAELHIDKMRFGANVDINRRFILSHEMRQCVTLQQKVEAQGLSTHIDHPGSWPGPLIPSTPVYSTAKEEKRMEKDYADSEPDCKVSRSHVVCKETRDEAGSFSQPPGRNDIPFPSQRCSKDGISTQYEEHMQALSSPTLMTPAFSKEEPHQTIATLTHSERFLQTSPTSYENQFRERFITSHADQEGSSSLFFSDTTPPDHFSHETSVSDEKNCNTTSPALLNYSDADADSPSLCDKDVSSSNFDEQARWESLSLSLLFRIHNLLEKISSLKKKAGQEKCTKEELSDGFRGVVLEHEKLVLEIRKPGQVLSVMEMKHINDVSEGSREALEDLVSK